MFPVIFVSLGPGEPELITVKGLKALQTADCIFCPETLAKDGNRVSRAADILLQLDIPENTVHRFPLPMSKQREKALRAPPSGNKERRSVSLPKEMPDSTLPYIMYMTNCRQTASP